MKKLIKILSCLTLTLATAFLYADTNCAIEPTINCTSTSTPTSTMKQTCSMQNADDLLLRAFPTPSSRQTTELMWDDKRVLEHKCAGTAERPTELYACSINTRGNTTDNYVLTFINEKDGQKLQKEQLKEHPDMTLYKLPHEIIVKVQCIQDDGTSIGDCTHQLPAGTLVCS